MNHPFLAMLLVTALAGCSDERAKPKAVFAESSDPKKTGAAQETTCSPLPAKVTLNFPHHLQSDYYHLNALQMIRRRVVMQYMQNDAAQVERSLKESMLAAGFTMHDSRTKNGQRHIRYHKKGYGMAHVFLKPNDGRRSAEPLVRGTLTFDLPPPQFNPPAAPRKAPEKKPLG